MEPEQQVRDAASSVEDDEQATVTALMTATRVLVGVATRALERLDAEVTLVEFRLLLALAELGPSPSVKAAAWLGIAGSSVTRTSDRLQESGHLRRSRERPNRSVVRLELTQRGVDLVERVVAARREELGAIVGRLPPGTTNQVATALELLVEAAGDGFDEPAVPAELRAP